MGGGGAEIIGSSRSTCPHLTVAWNPRGNLLGSRFPSAQRALCLGTESAAGVPGGDGFRSVIFKSRRKPQLHKDAGPLSTPLRMPGSEPSRLIPICLPPVEEFRFTVPSVEEHRPRTSRFSLQPFCRPRRGGSLGAQRWCQACDFPARARLSDGLGPQPGPLLLVLHLDGWHGRDFWSSLCV